jgi:pyruvate,water dikinase
MRVPPARWAWRVWASMLAVPALLAGCEAPAEVDEAPPTPVVIGPTECVATDEAPEFLWAIGCADDFDAVASVPLDASIPGARSVKTVIDRFDEGQLYFQNSALYPIHWEFASAHLSGDGLPLVPMLSDFNTTEYSSPSRRFLLGAVTHYEGPGVYAYEIAPYDLATADMILEAYLAIQSSTYFGAELRFYASSVAVQDAVASIADQVNLITQDELYAGIDYQPLNVAESYGRLRFLTAEALETSYVDFREIVVLDAVPNDISVVSGIITEEFQTPLSHINVLSRNRGTPNMGLKGAFSDPELRALEGQWVRFDVAATAYTVEAVSQAEADAWWEEHKPTEVLVPGLDASVTTLVDIEETVDMDAEDLKAAIKEATRSVGGKAAHYGVLAQIEGLPVPKAFAIPVHFYLQFMDTHGFTARVQEMLDDPTFQGDPAARDAALEVLRDDMKQAPLDPDFEAAVIDKLNAEYPGIRMRFRSSTNAEDLDGFTGAGLYTSKSADPGDPEDPVADAIRKVWASVWFFRAFEERSYRSIDHLAVAMALLVHHSFPDEEANGVALTNNPFDPSGLDPAFYINVQLGETSVVLPPAGVSTESLLYYFDRPEQPVTYLSTSSLTVGGAPVLSPSQLFDLGTALDAIRTVFTPAYGMGQSWWGMDVEFKFDDRDGGEPALFVKQARPYQ